MTKWQRRLRAAIAVFGLGFATVVYLSIREGRAPSEPSPSLDRVDRAAAVESTGGESRQLKGTREDFRVEYDRSLSYPDGRQRLLGVRVYADERAGRNFTLAGAEADVGSDEDRMEFRGGVELTAADGLRASASEATYAQSEGVVRASGGASFSEGRVKGSSATLTYDKNRDVLWLLERAVLDMLPDSPGQSAVKIVSANAGLARSDHYARFDGGFTLSTGSRVLQSDVATAYLSEDQSKVQGLEMRGGARATGLGDAIGSLRAMQADDLNIEFAADGRTLRAATLARNASIEMAGASGGARRIAAQWIDLRLAEDGVTVTSLSARDDVRLDLPAEGGQGAKSIRSASLVAVGEGGGGLTAATFLGGVEYRELPTDARAPRLARAGSMTLAVAAGFGEVADARFEGAFSFEEDRVQALSAEADYLVADGVVSLSGVDAESGAVPRVTDGNATIEGGKVTLTLEGRKIVAEGNVRSVLLPAAQSRPATAESPAPVRSSMLQAEQPVFATAQSLSYDGTTRRASYRGGARLWQGDTAVQGDTLTIDETTGNLTAEGQVRSTLMLDTSAQAPPDGPKAASRQPMIASADSFAYDEGARKATYLRDAHVSGPQGDLRAGRIEVILSESGKALGRVEAYTSVTLQDGDREATGDRLTYIDREGSYRMEGVPVRIVAQCRDIVGRTLTFFKSADTIIVDGNQEIRTQTKSGAACGDRRAP